MSWRIALVLGIGLGLTGSQLGAQTSGKAPLTIPVLQKRLSSAQNASDLPDNVKTKVVQYLQESIERLEIAAENTEKADKFERRLAVISDALQTAENKLADIPTAPDPSIADVSEIDELSRLVETRQKQLDDADAGLRKQIANLDDEAAQRRTRPEELMNELSEVEDRLREIEDELEGLATSGEARDLMQAHQTFLLARRQRAEAERRALQAEAAWFQSSQSADLLQAQREYAAKDLTLKMAELDLLEKELGKRRGDEADQRVHLAEGVVAKVNPALKPLAEENLGLAKEQRELASKLREVEQKHETTTTALAELTKEFERTQKMVTDVGLTDSIGLLLRQQRAKLLDRRAMRSTMTRRNDSVRETRMRLFQIDSDRAALIDLDAAILKKGDELSLSKDRKTLTTGLRSLLMDQRQLYKGLEADYARYFKLLVEMDIVDRRMLDLTTKYADYVDERVLWIRTGSMFGREHFARVVPYLTWISDPKLWKIVLGATEHNMRRQPLPWILAGLLLMTWLGIRPFLKRYIQQQGVTAAEPTCRYLWPTLTTLFASSIVASGWPLLIAFIGWRLDSSVSIDPFVHAVAAGLYRAATFAFPLEFLRIVFRRGALADRHFEWPSKTVTAWRYNVSWFLPIGVLLIGLVGLVEGTSDEHRLDTLGRLSFLAFAGLSAIFSHFAFRRVKGTAGEYVPEAEQDVWSDRFWRFAPFLAVTVPTGLLLLGWSGYFYTALQLTWRMQRTAWLAVGLLMVRASIRRWIALERRRMAVLQDEELQSITEASREPGTTHNPFLFPRWNWPEFRLNLTQIVTQMRRLLDTGLMTVAAVGLFFVWADVTPALNILDRFTLWQTTIVQSVPSKEAVPVTDGAPHETEVTMIRKMKPVTAADLGLAMVVLAIAIIAGRNIPGLVEVILLEHLSVDAGTRFAVTCLVRYVIFTAGTCCAFAQINIGWSNVQWLVAAASVGLGFGLQEIFCNFVSGIILLFERPMRVGDVITVGDTTGTVSRIRFRATTIVDGDRKELVVPNKEFITGKLLNWTLSDRVNRVGVKVVVGSNNDPQRVRRLLLEIASQHPQLLRDPAPSANLEDMNGGLTFMVRAFLPSLDARSSAINELYASIHNRLRAEGVEFPRQTQEVYVRMDPAENGLATPPAPHQPPTGSPFKPTPPDFGSAFRRA